MKLPIEKLTTLVAIQLAEFTEPLYGIALDGHSPLQDMTEEIAPTILLRLTQEAKLSECTDTKNFARHIYENTDWGYDYIRPCSLPSDFLRLHSLWMPDWNSPLNEDKDADKLLEELGESAPEWLRRRLSRATYRIVELGEGEKEIWFGPTDKQLPRQATYVPHPGYDTKTRTLTGVQPHLIPRLAQEIAEWIADI